MNNEKKKKAPWRIIVFILSIAFIVYLWVKKDVAAIYETMPKEQIAPLIATTVAVALCKIAILAGGILLIHWAAGKIRKK